MLLFPPSRRWTLEGVSKTTLGSLQMEWRQKGNKITHCPGQGMGQREGGPQDKSTRRGMWTWGEHPTRQVRKEGAGKAGALCGSGTSSCALVRPAQGAGSGTRLACFNKCYHCPNGCKGG